MAAIAQKPRSDTEIALVDAAMRLRLSYGQTLRLVLTGALIGRKTRGGRWMIAEASVRAVETHEPTPSAA